MPLERGDDLVRGDIPKLHGVIIASRGHEFTIGGKRDGPDGTGVPMKGEVLVAAGEAPQVAPLETTQVFVTGDGPMRFEELLGARRVRLHFDLSVRRIGAPDHDHIGFRHFARFGAVKLAGAGDDNAPAGRQYALLVGVKNYDKDQLHSLQYTESDVNDLAAVLKDAGYKRVVLCGIDLKSSSYFFQERSLYAESWDLPCNAEGPHDTDVPLTWRLPVTRVVNSIKRLIYDPSEIELFIESRQSALWPMLKEAEF